MFCNNYEYTIMFPVAGTRRRCFLVSDMTAVLTQLGVSTTQFVIKYRNIGTKPDPNGRAV
jgi:hypothetical protein